MHDDVRSNWLATPRKTRSAKAETPSWLLSSVVDLLAIHEMVHLEPRVRACHRGLSVDGIYLQNSENGFSGAYPRLSAMF
jgi:hypothetical protein